MKPLTPFESAVSLHETSRRRSARRRLKKRSKRSESPEVADYPEDSMLPAIGTMARTKRLILAAVRVWELKQGIRD
jgi:hypothetical protein